VLRNGQGQISLRNDAQPIRPGRPCKWSALCSVSGADSVVSAGCAGPCGTTIACSVAFDVSTPGDATCSKWRARTLSSRALRLDRPVRRLTVCAFRHGASFRGSRAGPTGRFGTTSSGPRMSLTVGTRHRRTTAVWQPNSTGRFPAMSSADWLAGPDPLRSSSRLISAPRSGRLRPFRRLPQQDSQRTLLTTGSWRFRAKSRQALRAPAR
jgi:hypothetical protein